jgi:hypothetical protein
MQRKQSDKPGQTSKDKAGIGQSNEEKGIAPKEEQTKKREEALKSGKAKKRPQFNGEPDDSTAPQQPIQFDE